MTNPFNDAPHGGGRHRSRIRHASPPRAPTRSAPPTWTATASRRSSTARPPSTTTAPAVLLLRRAAAGERRPGQPPARPRRRHARRRHRPRPAGPGDLHGARGRRVRPVRLRPARRRHRRGALRRLQPAGTPAAAWSATSTPTARPGGVVVDAARPPTARAVVGRRRLPRRHDAGHEHEHPLGRRHDHADRQRHRHRVLQTPTIDDWQRGTPAHRRRAP